MSAPSAPPEHATTSDVTHGVGTIARRPLDIVRHATILARRSVTKIFRTPEGLIDVTLGPIMFIFLFTFIFGGAVAGSSENYVQFLVPGIIGQNIAFASVGIGITLNADIEKGIFDRFRALPIARLAPLLGAVFGDVVRYVLLITVMLGTGFALGFRVETSPWHAAGAVVLAITFALSLAWAPVLVGLLARTQQAVQGIVFMTLFPLTFASSAFVPTETMPSWLAAFADANPLSHLVGAMRALFGGGEWQAHTVWTLGWCVVFLVVFMPLAIRAYNRRA